MKTIMTLVLAGTALAAGAAANAQTQTCTSSPCITVSPTANSGIGPSDIILFVTDTANGNSFVQDLGVTVDSLGVTTASVEADYAANKEYDAGGAGPGPLGSGGTITVGAGIINGSGVDSALAAWESTNSGGTFYYGIIGAANGNGSQSPGQGRFLATYTSTNGNAMFESGPSPSAVSNQVSNTTSFFADVNGNTGPSNGIYDYGSGYGVDLASFNGETSVAALGSTVYFYEAATYGTGYEGDGGAAIYASTDAIVVGSGGMISGLVSASSVPLPAAFWLLGSGVLGLFGIGRRRTAVAAGA